MYVRELHVQRLKRIRDLELSFPGPVVGDREEGHIPWTVIIGENCTGKTTILQAIALAAVGKRLVNTLARPIAGHLVDRRSNEPFSISSVFCFPVEGWRHPEHFPTQVAPWLGQGRLRLVSTLSLEAGEETLYGSSWYEGDTGEIPLEPGDDPLDQARSKRRPYWFVAAYGVGRTLPNPTRIPTLQQPSIDRLSTLFDPDVALTGNAFMNYFAGQPRRSQLFDNILRLALFPKDGPLLPDIVDFSLGSQGGVRTASDLLDRHRVKHRFGVDEVDIPAVALAHGYQSTIAWIADLVGHMLLDGQEVEPHQMAGLVLIDEIDLYIHPVLQVSLIRSLKQTFPRLQFIVSTHSPLVLAALRPDEDEVIRLTTDPDTGDVIRRDMKQRNGREPDARVMTTAGIYQRYFGLDSVFGGREGLQLARYQSHAGNPFRSDQEDEEMNKLREGLLAAGVEIAYAPVTRRQA